MLWDLDGVLIDSLEFDLKSCSPLLSKYCDKDIQIDEEIIRDNFALDHLRFWQALIKESGEKLVKGAFEALLDEYDSCRAAYPYTVLDNVRESFEMLHENRIRSTLVSSNTVELLHTVLEQTKLSQYFEFVVGFDSPNPLGTSSPLRKKPAPDMYRAATTLVDYPAKDCLAIEDSVTGATAAMSAGCPVIGVATGGTSFEDLQRVISKDKGYVARELFFTF